MQFLSFFFLALARFYEFCLRKIDQNAKLAVRIIRPKKRLNRSRRMPIKMVLCAIVVEQMRGFRIYYIFSRFLLHVLMMKCYASNINMIFQLVFLCHSKFCSSETRPRNVIYGTFSFASFIRTSCQRLRLGEVIHKMTQHSQSKFRRLCIVFARLIEQNAIANMYLNCR